MLLVLAIFFAILWLLNRFVFRPITAILDERDRDAQSASAAYAQAQSEFKAAADRIEADLSAARREALKLREERRAEGMKRRAETLEQIKTESAQRLDAATTELDGLSKKVSSDLPSRVASLAQTLAAKILGREVAA